MSRYFFGLCVDTFSSRSISAECRPHLVDDVDMDPMDARSVPPNCLQGPLEGLIRDGHVEKQVDPPEKGSEGLPPPPFLVEGGRREEVDGRKESVDTAARAARENFLHE